MRTQAINETNDLSVLKHYKKSFLKDDMANRQNEICPYCQTKKIQVGRFLRCQCSGMQIRTKSGIGVKRSLKFKP